jgi:4-hydroxy-tetrahydrodipicolinate synthase
MKAETLLRLASDFAGTIVAVKEASGDFEQLMDIIQNRPEGFLVVSGDDSITLPMIASGGDGVVSVIGNAYPGKFSAMVAAALEQSYEKARELHYQLFPMMKAIFKEGNPAGVKAAMEIQGWLENVLRLPLVSSSDSLYREISELNSRLQ